MGWKTLKERFEINSHIVEISGGSICIGTSCYPGLVTICPDTGKLTESPGFEEFLSKTYPKLFQANRDDILDAIKTPDSFSEFIPVYTFENGNIIKKFCEEPGWPNVTHDGFMMYENTFSTDKTEVVAWAKRDADRTIKASQDQIEVLQNQVNLIQKQIEDWEDQRQEAVHAKSVLDKNYPDIEVV